MPTRQPPIDELFPPAVAARECDVAKSTLDSAIAAGHCQCWRLANGQAVVTLDQVRAWLATDRRRGPKRQA